MKLSKSFIQHLRIGDQMAFDYLRQVCEKELLELAHQETNKSDYAKQLVEGTFQMLWKNRASICAEQDLSEQLKRYLFQLVQSDMVANQGPGNQGYEKPLMLRIRQLLSF